MKGFIQFIREQGVVGLAVGFILGGAISKLVTAIVTDILTPVIGLATSKAGNLADAYVKVGSARIMWGDLINVLIDFVVVAAVVYFGVKWLRLDKIDQAKK